MSTVLRTPLFQRFSDSGYHLVRRFDLSGIPGLQTFVKKVVQFHFTDEHLIGFNAHHCQVSLSVFCDEHRLGVLVTEFGYLMVFVSQIGARANGWHMRNLHISLSYRFYDMDASIRCIVQRTLCISTAYTDFYERVAESINLV
jgi:hypothetical protein